MGIRSKGGGAPVGSLLPFGGGVVPGGWLLCAGQAVSRTQYAALFLAIGSTFGAGDGATTFNVPDMRGRAVFGKDNMGGSAANRLTTGAGGVDGATVGAVGGGQTVTLTTAQIPAHSHLEAGGSGAGAAYSGPSGNATAQWVTRTVSNNPTADAGSGGAHQNVPPALVANYIIKA